MKLKIILSKTLLIAFLFCLSGCVGIQTVYNTKATSTMLPEWTTDGKYIGTKLINIDHVYTKQEVIDLIGEPRREWSEGNYEYLAYHNRGKGWKWYGVIIYAIIPVPLVIPVGAEESILIFQDNKLKEAIGDNSKGSFFGCIIFNTIHQNKDGSYNDKSIHDICAKIL
jgi:hypothetical protein